MDEQTDSDEAPGSEELVAVAESDGTDGDTTGPGVAVIAYTARSVGVWPLLGIDADTVARWGVTLEVVDIEEQPERALAANVVSLPCVTVTSGSVEQRRLIGAFNATDVRSAVTSVLEDQCER